MWDFHLLVTFEYVILVISVVNKIIFIHKISNVCGNAHQVSVTLLLAHPVLPLINILEFAMHLGYVSSCLLLIYASSYHHLSSDMALRFALRLIVVALVKLLGLRTIPRRIFSRIHRCRCVRLLNISVLGEDERIAASSLGCCELSWACWGGLIVYIDDSHVGA